MNLLRVAVLLLLLGCATSPFPYRAKLIVNVGGRELFSTGTVIASNANGALLFQYDDQTQGDNGYCWFDPADPHGRTLRRLMDSPMSARYPDAPSFDPSTQETPH